MFGFQDFLPIFQIALTLNFAVLAYFKYSPENSKDLFISSNMENMMEGMEYLKPYAGECKEEHKNIIETITGIYFNIKKHINIAISFVECAAIGMFFYSFFMLYYIATFKIKINADNNISSFLNIETNILFSYIAIPFYLALAILVVTLVKRFFYFNKSKAIHILILFLLFIVSFIISSLYGEYSSAIENKTLTYIIYSFCFLVFPFLPLLIGIIYLFFLRKIGEEEIKKQHGNKWESTLNPIIEQYKDRNISNTNEVTALVDEVTATPNK